MQLCVLDIDGTLMDSTTLDNACYVDAFEEMTGIRITDTDWSQFTHVTDPGLFNALFVLHHQRPARATEHARFKELFVRNIAVAAADPDAFQPAPGAIRFVDEYCRASQIAVAYATGGYGETARIKLRSARFNTRVPLAHADPHVTREQIVRAAIDEAMRKYATKAFDRITSFGDGIWDMRVAERLGLRFVGVDLREGGKLRRDGCAIVIHDFVDAHRLV